MMMRTGGTEAGREKLSETIETVGSLLLRDSQHSSHYITTPTPTLSCHLKLLSQDKEICTIEGLVLLVTVFYSDFFIFMM